MVGYTLNQHIDNIYHLGKIINELEVQNNDEKFEVINLLADFSSTNQQYNDLVSFSELVSLLVDIIEYCNSSDYSMEELNNKLCIIHDRVKRVLAEIKQTYQIKIYFKGKDKYKLIDKVISKNVEFLPKNRKIENGKCFEVLVISEETCNEVITENYDKLVNYDSFLNNCFNTIEQICEYNYDYNYLLNNIKRAKKSNIGGIIVGSSYSRNGIDVKSLREKYINLSLASQDIYYSYKIAKEIIEENKNIKKCIIGTGCYSFYLDISKSLNDGIPRIQNVYYPIFKDSHNYDYINEVPLKTLKQYVDEYTNFIFNVDNIEEHLSNLLRYDYKSYFNSSRTRESIDLLNGNHLSLLNINDKLILGKERAEVHNKLRKNIITKEENIKILNEFLEYLTINDVKPIIVNFNNTEYYNQFIDKEYMAEYAQIINDMRLKYEFTFIDLNNYQEVFKEEDFVDFDHMSDSGAYKVSNIISQL